MSQIFSYQFDAVFIAKVIDFVIFVTAIVFVYNKGLKPALTNYQTAQNKLVEDANAERAVRERSVAEAQSAIAQAKVDAARMIEVGRAQAAHLIESERVTALEHAQRIRSHASGELERERYRIRRELLEETVEQAHARAQEFAKAEIDAQKQQKLVERLMANLEQARA